MIDEDGDAKIRRNLVVFCTGVLLVSWLNLPIPELIERAVNGAATAATAPPNFTVKAAKIWMMAFIVLVYLYLRHRFSGEGLKSYAKIGEEWFDSKQCYIERYVERQYELGVMQKVFFKQAGGTYVPFVGDIFIRKHGQGESSPRPYDLPLWNRTGCVCNMAINTLLYSNAGIVHVVPLLLSLGALVVIVLKLGQII